MNKENINEKGNINLPFCVGTCDTMRMEIAGNEADPFQWEYFLIRRIINKNISLQI